MSDGSDARRPDGHDTEPAPDDQPRTSEELGRDADDSGGDGEAAGSVPERERIATDDDDTWGGDRAD